MTRLALALILCAAPVAAQDAVNIGGSGTTLRLGPSTTAGAVAELQFYNRPTNNRSHDGDYTLERDGLSVSVRFDWDATPSGHDRITVTVPEGYFAIPEELDLLEGDSGRVVIYPADLEAM